MLGVGFKTVFSRLENVKAHNIKELFSLIPGHWIHSIGLTRAKLSLRLYL